LAIVISPNLSFAADETQTATDYALILRQRPTAQADTVSSQPSTSELKMLSTGLIRFYQITISSQDGPACNFTPSCSRFTADAIKKAGLIRGSLLGADRLLRCHPFTRHRAKKTGADTGPGSDERIFDPVEQYLHFDADN